MKLTELLTEKLIRMELRGTQKEEIMREMADMLEDAGVLRDKKMFASALFEREQQGSTGIGFGVAIPHGKSDGVKTPAVALGIKRDGVDWASLDDEPAHLVFMIAVPEAGAGNEHLKILQMLSRKLIDEHFRGALLAAKTKQDVLSIIEEVE